MRPYAETVHESVRRLRPWTWPLAAGAALGSAWLVLHGGFDDLLPSEVGSALATVFLQVAVTWQSWRESGRELLLTLLIVLLGVVGWIGGRLATGWLPGVLDSAGAGGVALLLFLTNRARCRRGDSDDEDARLGGEVARLGLIFLLLTPTALALATATVVYLPTAWDAPALIVDSTFPFGAFDVGRFLARAPVLRGIASAVYDGIFLLVPALVAVRLRLPRPLAVDFLVVCVVVSLLGQLCYYVTPIVGPAFAFSARFPDTLPDVTRLPIVALPVPEFYRNGLPSIHTAWALVFMWATRPFAWWWRAFGVAVVVFMILATLGFGQHYVLDLVAAVPYAVVVQVACTRVPEGRRAARLGIVAGSAVLLAVWVLSPRFGVGVVRAAPGAVLVFALLSIVVPLVAERWLRAAET